MVTPISEEAAREALRRIDSEAGSTRNFVATRRDRGWSFGWSAERGSVPVGSHRWIVADNGRARRLGLRERADDAIAEELAK